MNTLDTLAPRSSPAHLAAAFSLDVFVNGYLREIGGGTWFSREAWVTSQENGEGLHGDWAVEISLAGLSGYIAFDVGYRSLVERHRFHAAYFRGADSSQWRRLGAVAAIFLLIQEIYHSRAGLDPAGRRELDIFYRTVDSIHSMARFIEARAADPGLLENTFLASEQSLLLGHWFHPTPKSQHGLTCWQQAVYSPELRGEFCLHYFAADQATIRERSAVGRSACDLIRDELGAEGLDRLLPGEVLVPAHPLQAQYLLQQASVQAALKQGTLRDLGCFGPVFQPTSSVRTVYRAASAWMYKFSIPVQITNSLRQNRAHELDDGPLIADVLRRAGFDQDFPCFHVIDDPAYLTVKLADAEESGFEVILRRNPFTVSQDRKVVSIAALTQEPLMPRRAGTQVARSRLSAIIASLSQKENRDIAAVGLSWFRRYWQCAIEPLLLLYERFGIALEAHQQNSLIEITEDGYPLRFYYRDNQGFYLSAAYRETLEALNPEVSTAKALFYDDAVIRQRLSYYLVMNHLCALVYRFGADGILGEAELLAAAEAWLRNLRQELSVAGAAFIDFLLTAPTLPCKANLLTRVQGVDELETPEGAAIHIDVENPFLRARRERAQLAALAVP